MNLNQLKLNIILPEKIQKYYLKNINQFFTIENKFNLEIGKVYKIFYLNKFPFTGIFIGIDIQGIDIKYLFLGIDFSQCFINFYETVEFTENNLKKFNPIKYIGNYDLSKFELY